MYKIPLQNRMLQMLKKMEEFHFAGKCELQNKGCHFFYTFLDNKKVHRLIMRLIGIRLIKKSVFF
jgi:hypothetical protein